MVRRVVAKIELVWGGGVGKGVARRYRLSYASVWLIRLTTNVVRPTYEYPQENLLLR